MPKHNIITTQAKTTDNRDEAVCYRALSLCLSGVALVFGVIGLIITGVVVWVSLSSANTATYRG